MILWNRLTYRSIPVNKGKRKRNGFLPPGTLLLVSFIAFAMFADHTISANAPAVAYLPPGKWEEKAGSAKLHILHHNQIIFTFSGALPRQPCQIHIDGILRTEYYGAVNCENIQYNRAIFYYNRDSGELELTFIQNRAFYQTYIFIIEGTRKPAPEI
jgi:hypothetical protein